MGITLEPRGKVSHESPRRLIDLEALAKRAQEGDRSALDALCEGCLRDVARILARLGAGADEVDDLVQSCMLQLCRSISTFQAGSTFRVWLFGLCARVYLHHRRTRGRFRRMLEAFRGALDLVEPSAGPLEIASDREVLARIEERLQTMSPKLRAVFVLREVEGLSGEEVASALGVPLGTVWTRIHHARRALLEALEDGDV